MSKNKTARQFWGVLTRAQVHKSGFLKTSTVQLRENMEGRKGGYESQSEPTLRSGLHMSSHVPLILFLFYCTVIKEIFASDKSL